MVKEAEEAADEDRAARERVEARNSLENYAYSVRNTISDGEKFAEIITDAQKSTIEAAVTEVTDWIDVNMDATKEEFDEKYKELESIVQPIFTELYQQTGGDPNAAGAGGFPGGGFDDMEDL